MTSAVCKPQTLMKQTSVNALQLSEKYSLCGFFANSRVIVISIWKYFLTIYFICIYNKTMWNKLKNLIAKEKVLLVTIMIVYILDKITKNLISMTYQLGESKSIIGNFFKITYIENQGIAFGLLSDWQHSYKTLILFVISLIAIIIIFKIYRDSKRRFIEELSFGLILGGAAGNIFDRIVYQRVVDFFNFGIGQYRWPFFNIADSCITIGVIIFLIISMFYSKEQKNEADSVRDK